MGGNQRIMKWRHFLDRLTHQQVENYPLGYPRQAAFADSDESFLIYRRFGNVHARLLLHQQDELRQLEADLLNMDLIDSKSENGARCLKSRDLDEERPATDGGSRSELLKRMGEKTIQYGKNLCSTDSFLIILPDIWPSKTVCRWMVLGFS